MKIILLFVALGIIFFGLLYSIYKTKRYNHPKQISAAVIGSLLLVYILYTCNSDD